MILFEGLDGSGKTTQLRLLERRLRERFAVTTTREPTDGQWGMKIRRLALEGREAVSPETEARYFMEDRKEDLARYILPALERREIVLIDRYFYSNMAYQGARGLDPERIRAENLAFAPQPDLVLVMDVPPELGIRRIEQGRKERRNDFETLEGLRRVSAIYEEMREPHIRHVDGTAAVDAVRREVWRHVREVILGALANGDREPFLAWERGFDVADCSATG
jgi:dTMP kinase